jgi:hypothetical protein
MPLHMQLFLFLSINGVIRASRICLSMKNYLVAVGLEHTLLSAFLVATLHMTNWICSVTGCTVDGFLEFSCIT